MTIGGVSQYLDHHLAITTRALWYSMTLHFSEGEHPHQVAFWLNAERLLVLPEFAATNI